jgi:hypothetical protein
LVQRWIAKDATPVRETVSNWVKKELSRQQLEAETLIGLLQEACEKEVGQAPETTFADLVEPFVPKGRRGPEPDPAAVLQALGAMEELVGTLEVEAPGSREAALLPDVMAKVGESIQRKWTNKMLQLATSLVENPDFRLRGAEETLRQLTAVIDETIESHEPVLHDLEHESADAHARIHELVQALEAGGGRRLAAIVTELIESLRQYPRCRYQALMLRRVANIYVSIRGKLSDQMREFTFCRQRLAEIAKILEGAGAASKAAEPVPGTSLLPAGCQTLDDSVEGLVGKLTAAEIRNFDQHIQEMISQQFHSLLQASLNSVNVVKSLEAAMLRLAETLAAGRLAGGANVVEMFLAQHADDEQTALHDIAGAYNEAVPELARKLTCDEPEIRILALPTGPAAEKFRGLLRKALSNTQLVVTDSSDDIIIYREQPAVPLDKLELLGATGREAYKHLNQADNFTPHSREDITDWRMDLSAK